jgi:hypothetical protein
VVFAQQVAGAVFLAVTHMHVSLLVLRASGV